MGRGLMGALLGGLLLFTTAQVSEAAAPANDNFSSRAILTLNSQNKAIATIASANEATTESGELNLESAYPHTVWYQWTAPNDGILRIEGTGSQYEHYINIYIPPASSANFTNLRQIWSGEGAADYPVVTGFPVTKGATFCISYGARQFNWGGHSHGTVGKLTLTLDTNSGYNGVTLQRPSTANNDAFANRSVIPQGTWGTILIAYHGNPWALNRATSREAGEPAATSIGADYGTLWWQFKMPYTGIITLKRLAGQKVRISGWRGGQLSSLQGSYTDSDTLTINANTGETLYFALADAEYNAATPYTSVSVSVDFAPGGSPGQVHRNTAQYYYDYYTYYGYPDTANAYYYYFIYLADYADLTVLGDTAGALWAYYTGVSQYQYYSAYRYWPNYANYQLYLYTGYAWYSAYISSNAATAQYYLDYHNYYANYFYYLYAYYGY